MDRTCRGHGNADGTGGIVRGMSARSAGKKHSHRPKQGKKAAVKRKPVRKKAAPKRKKPAAKKKAVKKKAATKRKKLAAKKKTVKKKATTKRKKLAAKKKAVKKKAATKRKKPAAKKKAVKKKAARGKGRAKKRKSRARGKMKPRRPFFAATMAPPALPSASLMARKALALFEKGMKQFHLKHYERAEAHFQRLVETFPQEKEMYARVQVFLQLCEQQLGGEERVYKDPEDHYYRAVILSNRGRFNRAGEHLEEALKMVRRRKKPSLQENHIQYVLACTHALSGRMEDALISLCEAVRLNPRNRILALNSPDFRELREDGRLEQALSEEGLG